MKKTVLIVRGKVFLTENQDVNNYLRAYQVKMPGMLFYLL